MTIKELTSIAADNMAFIITNESGKIYGKFNKSELTNLDTNIAEKELKGITPDKTTENTIIVIINE